MIKVLVIDDSALVRDILSEGLARDPEIQVVGSAPDPYVAREKIAKLRPDVLTLDIEMPRMDGVQFLRYMMPQYPLPVVVVSALTEKGKRITMEALEAGAVDFVTKPSSDVARGLEIMLEDIRQKVKQASMTDVSHWKQRTPTPAKVRMDTALSTSTDKVIAIGASTGGVQAISRILTQLPATLPGIVIVQHMPPGFTQTYAERLNEQCAIKVKEAKHGDRIMPGQALLAPGNLQMTVKRSGGVYLVHCEPGEKVSGHCPSVDVLFDSVARFAGANAIGIILTGMGNDGAAGMLSMRRAGARTMAQDEKSCVVFGMPCEAYKSGGAEFLISLDNIPHKLVSFL
ncbi:MAG: chemotaxis response regulator protein-glutamate methylesterase [SAR324 cluster bacterium]|nr:chemotaxis response regulator protein-glutamate methylesterase [SAR324 cluster bacterium]